VRDGKGGLVSDLTAEDFVVREDGRLQGLEIFAPAALPAEREELALNLGMLFDTSESMRKDLKLSQESAVRFLEAIPRARDLMLIFFDRDIRISRYNSENQQGIFGRILERRAGYTALRRDMVYLSRVETPGARPGPLHRRDDDERASPASAEDGPLVRRHDLPGGLLGRAQSEQRGGASRPLLPLLARRAERRARLPAHGFARAGRHLPVDDELGTQYVLGYVSDNPKRDGKFRKIAVEVARPGLKLRHRPGYDAPREEPGRASKRK
jgi:Ca-activated chloride channel family protein